MLLWVLWIILKKTPMTWGSLVNRNNFIKYHSIFAPLSPQGHSTDICSSYDGSWDIQIFNKWSFSTLTAAFFKSFGALQNKNMHNDDFAFPVSPAFWSHAEQRENTSHMFILSKTIGKPTQQDTTFLTLGCCLAACENTFSHTSSS